MRRKLFALFCVLSAVITSINSVPAVSAKASQTGMGTGTTYYISSRNGDNANAGTSQTAAWETLDKLIGLALHPGDSILLEAGSVFEDSYIHLKDVHGTADAPIVIGSYGEGAKPAIHANGQGIWYQDYKGQMDDKNHKSKGYISSAILLYDVDFVEISDLEITNQSNDFDYFTGSVSSVSKTSGRMDRTGVSGIAKDGGVSEHIYLDNLYIHDVDGNIEDKHVNNGGIQINATPPENEAATGIARYDDVKITNCYVKKVSRAGICVGYTYKNGQFTGRAISDEKAQTYGHTRLVISNNYVKDIGNDGIVAMYAFRPLVEYNVLDHAGADLEVFGNGTPPAASSFHQALCAGIWPWKCKDGIFQYNEAFDMVDNQDGQPWDVDYSDGTIYQYNYSHNNGGGCLMLCGGEAYQGVFRYNISQNDLKTLMHLASNPNGYIYNNVFYLSGDVSTKLFGGSGPTEIKNNIFYNVSTDRPTSETIVSTGRTFANNIFYGYTGATLPAGSITDDPKFIDPGKAPTADLGTGALHDRDVVYNGYKLQADSPAINAGVAIAGTAKYDFFGNEVGLLPDIGAYESDTPETDAPLTAAAAKGFPGIVGADKITGVPKNTTVKALKDALIIAKGVQLQILSGGAAAADDARVTADTTVKLTRGGTEKIYGIENAIEYLEYDRTTMTATAGSVEKAAEDASKVLDGNTSTIWHTAYAGCPRGDTWIQIDLGSVKPVAMVKYVSRTTGGLNGIFEDYEIKVRSSENDGWTLAASGTWRTSAVGSTEYAKFDTVNARYVRIVCTKNRTAPGGSEGKIFGSASEIRIGYEKE